MMCPRCGAEERLGVWLSRTEVLVFDTIKRAGEDGAPWDRIAETVSYAHDRPCGRDTVKSHVQHIRDRLVETDWTIRGSQGGKLSAYRLIKQRDYTCRSIKSKSATRSATVR